MTTKREKPKPQINKQLKVVVPEPKAKDNQRKEKLSNYLIDVSKYVLTGVVITSLFNDVTSKTTIYLVGLGVVLLTLWTGIILTNIIKVK